MADPIGTITTIHGNAMAEGIAGVRTLQAGAPVYEDETITTKGTGSAVEITFTDGSLLSQGPNATSVLDDHVFNPDQNTGEMAISPVEGTFRSVTGSIVDLKPEGFQIDTPLATIGIRGTVFGIRKFPPAKAGEPPTIVVGAIDFEKVNAGYSGTETSLNGECILFEDLGNGTGHIWYDSNGSDSGGQTLL